VGKVVPDKGRYQALRENLIDCVGKSPVAELPLCWLRDLFAKYGERMRVSSSDGSTCRAVTGYAEQGVVRDGS
jgi:hypothetical protein